MRKLKTAKKKPQVRRCGLCQKVGHNTSTCSKKAQKKSPVKAPEKTVTQPLKFFIHHVNYQPTQSSHVVDLKNETKSNVWDKVGSSAPEETTDKNKDYYYHHNRIFACRFGDDECEKIADQIKKFAEPIKPEDAPPEVKAEICHLPAPTQADEKKEIPIPAEMPKKIPRAPFPFFKKIKNLFVFRSKRAPVHAKKVSKKHISPRRVMAAAAVLTLAFLIPGPARTYFSDVKNTTDTIANSGTSGFNSLQESTTALMRGDITAAQTSLSAALKDFNLAVNTMENRHPVLQSVASGIPILENKVRSGQQLIMAGQDISLGNTYLIRGLSEIKDNPSSTIGRSLEVLGSHLDAALPNYEKAFGELSEVDPDTLPFEHQDSFKEFRILYSAFLSDLQNLAKISKSTREIFGGAGLRRYLLVFQNPAEIRPTGGFIGSMAVLDINDGNIVRTDIPAGGSYDLQGQLDQFVEPPSPLLISNSRWEFQDANWFPDFPASAQKMMWFYRHSRKMSVDGVIAINASVLSRILSVMGPVNDASRNLNLTQGNALATIQDIVEYGPEKKDNKPKQILADLAPVFLSYFQKIDPTSALPLLANLQDALEQKEIQAYFADENTEASMKDFGWSGQIVNTNDNQDYLFVVDTNIQGQKSDAKINQTVSHQAMIQPDGTIIDSVIVTREHTGDPSEKLYGQTNINYLRVYIPAGSEFISASGFAWPDEQKFRAPNKWSVKDEFLAQMEKEISIDSQSGTRVTSEFGKYALGNWVITEPGQTTQVQFVYKLPFKAWDLPDTGISSKWAKLFQSSAPISNYQLITQKQSGVSGNFESQIIYPAGWKPVWQDGQDMRLASNGATINKTALTKDGVWSLVMTKNEQ